jgi:hypothetical protein
MANALQDGLNLPDLVGSPIKVNTSGNSTFKSLNGQAIDFGTVTGSGNTSVVVFSKTFSATPTVFCFPTVGSVAVASLSVVSNLNAGSFSVATGSNIANYWIAVGSGSY